MFRNVRVPSWRGQVPRRDALEELKSDLTEWISSPPLVALAARWEPNDPPLAAHAGTLFDWFDEVSAKYWDFRAGAERNLARVAELGSDVEATVLAAAAALGLRHARPPEARTYDATLVLGGLVRACVVRPRYAAALSEKGFELGEVVALGGFRPLAGDEIDLACHLGMSADDEFGAMVEGTTAAFNLSGAVHYEGTAQTARDNSSWCIAHFDGGAGISVIAAPSSEPATRRANTIDTYNWWAQRKTPLRGARLLLITSTIYVPYQGAGAIQTLALRYGAEVETVGVPDGIADLGAFTQVFTAPNYLQEIRSSIRGYRTLYQAVTTELSVSDR